MPNDNGETSGNMLAKLKGDQIGGTMYSERFVLKLLLSFQNIDWNGDYESNLCTLWDMTTDRDVAVYLADHNFFAIILPCIQKYLSQNPRLIEILIGITSNMCSQAEILDKMFQQNLEVFHYLFGLIRYHDANTLLQLFRLLQIISRSKYKPVLHTAIEEVDEFLDGLAFIFNESTKKEVLIAAANFVHFLAYKYDQNDIDTPAIDYVFSIPPLFNAIVNFIKTAEYFQSITNQTFKINFAFYQVLADWGTWLERGTCDAPDVFRDIRAMFRLNLVDHVENFVRCVFTMIDSEEYDPEEVMNNTVLIIGGFEFYAKTLALFFIKLLHEIGPTNDIKDAILINSLYLMYFATNDEMIELLQHLTVNEVLHVKALLNTTEVVAEDVKEHIKHKLMSIENNL